MKDGTVNFILRKPFTQGRMRANHELLSADDENELAIRWLKKKDQAARDRILLAYQPLCVSVARRMAPRHLFSDDIVQEGMLGLMHALDKFDPSLGFRFGTYARWWVKAEISKALMTSEAGRAGLTGETVRMRRTYDQTRRIVLAELRKTVLEPSQQMVRLEVASRMGVSLQIVEQFEGARGCQSLNAPVGDDDGKSIEMIDLLPGDDLGGEARLDLSRREAHQERMIGDLYQALTPREADIIDRRFGRNRKKETLREIAEDLGLTNERIRQIEVKALQKMRDAGQTRIDLSVLHETLGLEDAL